MYSANDNENPDLKYVKEQLEREERSLAEVKKKLDFETKEQASRVEQFERRQKAEQQKLEAQLSRNLDGFKDTLNRKLTLVSDKSRRSQIELQHFEHERQMITQKIEQELKRAGKTDRSKSLSEIKRHPEMIRIENQIQNEKRNQIDYERKLQFQTRENEKELQNFERRQKLEFEKLVRQHEREKNAFVDSWKRAEKFLQDKIKMTESMTKRLKSEYDQKNREFEMEKKRRQKSDSDKRAQHGSDDVGKNFATPGTKPIGTLENHSERGPRGRW